MYSSKDDWDNYWNKHPVKTESSSDNENENDVKKQKIDKEKFKKQGPVIITDRYKEAFDLAYELHKNQTRKGSSIPYMSHLESVATQMTSRAETLIAAAGLATAAVLVVAWLWLVRVRSPSHAGQTAGAAQGSTSSADEAKRKVSKPPQLSPGEVEAVVKDLFDYPGATFVSTLDSYDDRNYLIQVAGERFVLKFHNGVESVDLSFVCAQMEALNWLRKADLLVPEDVTSLRIYQSFAVRLLRFIPGEVLAMRPCVSVQDGADLYRRLGKFIGAVDARLQSFAHPAAVRTLLWDLSNFPTVRPFTTAIKDEQRRAQVLRVFDDFDAVVAPLAPKLGRSVIQNDVNDRNVIVLSDGNFGLIDFGDMVWTWTVNELAIALAYVLITALTDPAQRTVRNADGWLSLCAAFFSGYQSSRQLTDEEQVCLFPLVCARLAMSYTMGAYSHSLEPTNDYLLVHATPAGFALEVMQRLGAEAFMCSMARVAARS